MNRAYATLAIKGMDEDSGTMTGIASTPSPDRMDDVVVPKGATFKLPLPLLWQHNHGDPIGEVIEATVTDKGIEVVAKVALGVTDEIDRYWKLLKSGLVRGLSIGFRGLDVEQIDGSWGVKFNKWEWMELSAVTIPANAEASIATVKEYAAKPAATGTGKDAVNAPGVAGKSHKSISLTPKEGKLMKTLSEQIAAFEAKRAASVARMDEIQNAAVERGESKSADEKEEFQALKGEVAEIDDELKDLRDLERTKATSAKPVSGTKNSDSSGARDPRAPVKVKAAALPPGIEFTRLAKVKALAKIEGESPREMARQIYGDDSSTYGILQQKAAVPAGATVSGNWAADLVSEETGAVAEFLEFLRPMTILGKFGNGGIPSLNQIPFDTPLISQTGGGNAYWVGEGKPKPLTNFGYSRTTLPPLKVATIAAVTDELLRRSSISAEANIRDSLARAVAERVDIDFIDPSKAASAGVSPASITNGVAAIGSSGNDADAIREDIRALMATYIAANNPPMTGVFVMSASTALALSLMRNPLGQTEFPNITMAGGTLEGLPVITSEYFAAVSDGGFVALVNARDIWFADEGGIMVDMSREASLEMKDSSLTQAGVAGTGVAQVSLWQTNMVGFRAERILNWAKARASAVAVLDEVNWGLPS